MARSRPMPVITSFTRPLRPPSVCLHSSARQPFSNPYTTSSSLRSNDLQPEQEDTSNLYSNRGRELRDGLRWDSTPPRMMAPFRSKPKVMNNDFEVNRDPDKLDQVYQRVLGQGGQHMLTEEVKWLAVTHKSFDHGRRGYNDRLAYLGRRIIELQASLTLLHGASTSDIPPAQDEFGREPFQHPSLQGLDGLTAHAKVMMLEKKRVAQLASGRYGLDEVLRWKPKKMVNLQASGIHIVLAQALYAIVGAVALQRGGEVANVVVKERILNPLRLQ
ncbi:hypothetical protein ACLMJK_001345 [Lecanora helva]